MLNILYYKILLSLLNKIMIRREYHERKSNGISNFSPLWLIKIFFSEVCFTPKWTLSKMAVYWIAALELVWWTGHHLHSPAWGQTVQCSPQFSPICQICLGRFLGCFIVFFSFLSGLVTNLKKKLQQIFTTIFDNCFGRVFLTDVYVMDVPDIHFWRVFLIFMNVFYGGFENHFYNCFYFKKLQLFLPKNVCFFGDCFVNQNFV